MFDRIKALTHRWQDLKEIAQLSQRDLDDLGMTRDQVEAFARMPQDVPDRVRAMVVEAHRAARLSTEIAVY